MLTRGPRHVRTWARGAVSASEVTGTPDADGGPGAFPPISRETLHGACHSCLSGAACPPVGTAAMLQAPPLPPHSHEAPRHTEKTRLIIRAERVTSMQVL